MKDWRWLGAAELGRGIEAGRVDPLDLVHAYLDAIDAHADCDRIYARVTRDRALAEAAAARDRARAGLRRSPLDGVPVSWKDVFDTAGTATEAGTALMSGRVPERDAEVLETAGAMGLVCLGKTHLSEIAFSGLGYNPVTATPPNRHDADVAPGGSSSGAAASVAFGLAAAAIGTDTGGSVRIPAAWNDLVGLKTTHGRLPTAGVVPLCAGFDSVGPLARSAEDAALLLSTLEGARAPDLENATLDGARFLVIETILLSEVEDLQASTFEAAVGALQAAGATVERRAWPALEEVYALSAPLYGAEAWAAWRDRVEPAPEVMYHHILTRVRAGRDVPAADYIAARARLCALRADYAVATAGHDAVLAPTAALMPPKIADLTTDDEVYVAANLKTLRNTRVANLMGLCSITLPTGIPACGLMLNAAAGDEARLLRLATAAERTLTQMSQ